MLMLLVVQGSRRRVQGARFRGELIGEWRLEINGWRFGGRAKRER